MTSLARDLRKDLEKIVKQARRVAEAGARQAVEQLGVGEGDAPKHLTPDQRGLRNRLRAHGRQLGDRRDAKAGTQTTSRLVQECAYEHWHRMLFARFLAETNLLIEPDSGVAITLDEVQEDGGWIFVRDGAAFAAVKVVAGGYAWTAPWRHSDAVVRNQKDFLTPRDGGESFIVLKSEASPVIALANDAADYQNDFGAFKAAVKAQPLEWAGGVLRFATITFRGPAGPGQINDQPVNLASSRGYDSPFIRSDWNSGLIHIRRGNETAILDFRDPTNPVKTVGGPVTAAFPPGVGSTRPVVFGRN